MELILAIAQLCSNIDLNAKTQCQAVYMECAKQEAYNRFNRVLTIRAELDSEKTARVLVTCIAKLKDQINK
jgi:hypothetical protein